MNDDFSAFLPLETVSEANAASHAHWRIRAHRAKSQRTIVSLMLRQKLGGRGKPSFVQFTRFAARSLDPDNLNSAHKAIQDELASILGFNDRDKAVLWRYDQQKPAKGAQHGTGVRISWKALERCPCCGQAILPS